MTDGRAGRRQSCCNAKSRIGILELARGAPDPIDANATQPDRQISPATPGILFRGVQLVAARKQNERVTLGQRPVCPVVIEEQFRKAIVAGGEPHRLVRGRGDSGPRTTSIFPRGGFAIAALSATVSFSC